MIVRVFEDGENDVENGGSIVNGRQREINERTGEKTANMQTMGYVNKGKYLKPL